MWGNGGRGEVYGIGREGMGLEKKQGGVWSFPSQSVAGITEQGSPGGEIWEQPLCPELPMKEKDQEIHSQEEI